MLFVWGEYHRIGLFLMVFSLILGQAAVGTAAPQLTISWRDNSTNETGFKIERKKGTAGIYAQIVQVGANVTSFIDTNNLTVDSYCYRVRAYNAAGNSAFSNEDCGTPLVSSFTLTVGRSGTGQGTVTSSPTGISCGSDCSQSYSSTTSVTLSAAPAPGSTFSGWSGGCSGTGTCTLLINANTSVTATFTATTTPPPTTSGLAVSYAMNEGSGTTLTDTSGNSRTGTLSGATWTTAGKYGTALAFNGGTARVTSGVTTHTTVRSFSLWTFRTGDGNIGVGRLFDKRTSGGQVELFKNDAPANAYTYERVWSGSIARWTIPRPSANVWHHIVVIYNASSTANNPQIYVDGVAQPVTRRAAPSGSPLTNTNPYVLGNRGAGDRGWSGRIDEFRIYDRALTSTEIQSLMTTPIGSSQTRTLTVTKSGTGAGTVSSNPAGINCGTSCSSTFTNGQVVTLSAVPTSGSTFSGWSGGGCSGTGSCTVTLTASTPVTATFVAPQVASGLVAAYSFNAGSGTTVADTSGRNNTGTISGATWTTSGRFGRALSFDGVNDVVTINDASSLDLTTGMTLEAWVYPTTSPRGWRTIVTKEQPNEIIYFLHASSNSNRPTAGIFIGAERKLSSDSQLAAGTWTHLAATYDGTTQRLYINGVQVASRFQSGAMPTSASPLRIGGNAVWGEYFQGRIDELRIYNRALTSSEIQRNMMTPVGP